MNKETIVYTMRHAHTDYNNEKRYAGTIDISINERGIEDISEIKNRIDTFNFDIVITSRMKRCIETANLLFDGKVPVIQKEICNERCYGVMEGLTWDDVQKLDPPVLFIEVGDDLHSVNPENGEPFEDVWERAKGLRRFILENYQGSSVLVISHGAFLQMFHGLLRGISCIESLADYPGNLELNKFTIQDQETVSHQVIKLSEQESIKW